MLADECEQLLVLLRIAKVRQVRLHDENADRPAVAELERNPQPVLGQIADQFDFAELVRAS